MWIELGFGGQRTQRTDPQRVARYWLIVAVATVWGLAYGTRVEDAQHLGLPPARVLTPPAPPAQPRRRLISLFRLGLRYLQQTLRRGRLWRRLWLAPESWPEPPPGLNITIHCET
jgi:hypothetical protein